MSVKLLTEYNLEFPSLTGGCTVSSESTFVKNATLLEITCHGSYVFTGMQEFICIHWSQSWKETPTGYEKILLTWYGPGPAEVPHVGGLGF